MYKKIALAVGFVAAGILPGAAAEITMGHGDPGGEWYTSMNQAASVLFESILESEAEADLTVNVYPAGQLGSEADLLQSVQSGAVQVAMAAATFSSVCPEAAVFDVPYLFSSEPDAWQLLDGPIGTKLRDICIERAGVRILGYGESGFRHFTNSRGPISGPSDLSGLKVRVMQAPQYIEMLSALGAEPTPIPFPDLPAALATGVVDGQENPISVIVYGKLYESQDYLSLDGHTYTVAFMLINEDFFQSLTADQQALVERAGKASMMMHRSIQQLNSAQGLTELTEQGMQVNRPDADSIAEFKAVTQPAVIDWLRTTDADQNFINEVLDAAQSQ